MTRVLPLFALLCSGAIGLSCSGCRNSGGAFAMDSDSGSPFLGLNFALPQRLSRRSISDESPTTEGRFQTAELTAASSKKTRLPRWLGGGVEDDKPVAIPLPQDAPIPLRGDEIELSTPQQEFP
ncbi:MAG: hypothetical protein R3C01_13850 [Planctomycetaceae bacterium]